MNPLFKYYNVSGNSITSQANVFCIAVETPACVSAGKLGIVIDQIGSEYLIYGELMQKGEKRKLPFRLKSAPKKKVFLQGCDIPSMGILVETLEKRSEEIQKLKNAVSALKHEPPILAFRASLKKKKGPLWALFEKIAEDFPKDWQVSLRKMTLLVEPREFAFRFAQFLTAALSENKRKQRELFEKTIQVRLRHFQSAIKEGLDTKKKVILIANHRLLIASQDVPQAEKDIAEFHRFLNDKKVVFLTSKQSSLQPPFFAHGSF